MSIIIPCHNDGPLLLEAVESAMGQTHADVEVLVVADGPQDASTQATLDGLHQRESVRVLSKPHGGVSAARNLGIREAIGDYLLFLDADDRLASTFASLGVEALGANRDAFIFGGQTELFGSMSGPYGPPFTLAQFLHDSLLQVGQMVRTADARRIDGFDENLPRYEDHDFFLRILSLAPDAHRAVIQVPETLYHYRKHGRSVTSQADDALDLACQAIVLRSNASLIGRYAEDYIEYRQQKYGLLNHYRRRYGALERRLSQGKAVARRATAHLRRHTD
ncbi:glycosyltransferase [Micrococcus luteus]|uniref:glycosyltransferase n=1 Tax=Micrococcus luteus TaxID=1270 RepID=UPI00080DE8C9|nr:glycosyltransferase [Micrococcus luteus]